VIFIVFRAKKEWGLLAFLFLYYKKQEFFGFSFSFRKISGTQSIALGNRMRDTFTGVLFLY